MKEKSVCKSSQETRVVYFEQVKGTRGNETRPWQQSKDSSFGWRVQAEALPVSGFRLEVSRFLAS